MIIKNLYTANWLILQHPKDLEEKHSEAAGKAIKYSSVHIHVFCLCHRLTWFTGSSNNWKEVLRGPETHSLSEAFKYGYHVWVRHSKPKKYSLISISSEAFHSQSVGTKRFIALNL